MYVIRRVLKFYDGVRNGGSSLLPFTPVAGYLAPKIERRKYQDVEFFTRLQYLRE